MATLAISRKFLEGFNKLEPRLRNKVSEHADTFARLTAQELRALKGLHLESHTNAADPRARTIRISQNYRGIVMDAGNDDLFILMAIGTHDETDRWMAQNTFKVNSATGALEVHNVQEVEAKVAAASLATDGDPLFAHRKDKDFTQLGVDADLLPALRAFTDEDQLLGLLGVLPQTQADVLIGLTSDASVEQIYTESLGRRPTEPVDTEDLVASLATSASQSFFRVVDGQDELNEMLSQPLAFWRTFVHPSQRGLIDQQFNGPARVTGGAGTGKTVVAVHRARYLGQRVGSAQDHGSSKPVLFTTYTRNLAQAIEQDLRSLGKGAALEQVDVANIDRVAYRIVQDAEGQRPNIADADQVGKLWQQVIDDRGMDFTSSFLNAEWEQVILAQNIDDRTGYLKASRAGRGVPLDRRARANVWKAVEELTKLLVDNGARTYLQIAQSAAGYLDRRSVKPFQHVVVDEAQDLHETQWRLIRALVAEGPDDLFIVGDSHQRIYDRRSSLSKVGINIRGRSRKLKINYRTTHEILAWSLSVLGDGDFDDLDEGTDHHDFAGYHSYHHGPVPTMSGHDRRADQMDALVKQVKQWIADQVKPEEIAVTARSRGRSFDRITAAFDKAGVQHCVLPTDMPRAEGVRIGTMHRLKGLEFKRVAIVDLTDEWFPEPLALSEDDQAQRAADLQREACLLYVAATRARDDLWVGWYGQPSRFLGAVLKQG